MLKSKALRHGRFVYYDTEFIGRILDTYGEWAERELAFLLSLIPEGGTVVDVGAHFGTFTVPFARAVGPQGCVVAYEAQRHVFANLQTNIFVNELGNVRAHNTICAREAYHLALSDLALDQVHAHGAFNSGAFSIPVDPRQAQSWRTTRAEPLDATLAGIPRVDLIKIDVEGFELDVLAGARATLERLRPPVHCEVLGQPALDGLIRISAELGYSVLPACFDHYNPDNFFARPMGPAIVEGGRDINILLWPEDRPRPAGWRFAGEVGDFESLRVSASPVAD